MNIAHNQGGITVKNNKYNGYIYDECSWGMTIFWEDDAHDWDNSVQEVYYNEFRDMFEVRDWLHNNKIARSLQEYHTGDEE